MRFAILLSVATLLSTAPLPAAEQDPAAAVKPAAVVKPAAPAAPVDPVDPVPVIISKTIPETTNSPAASGVIRFQNGDLLHGELVSIDPQKHVRWKNPSVQDVMEFTTADIAKLRPGYPASVRPKAPHHCLVRLANGDELMGVLVSLDVEKVALQTWYAGEVTLPRKQVKSIRPSESGRYLYEGPTGLEGWTVSQTKDDDETAWKYSGGVLVARRAGAVARDFKLPDVASIDLDAAWRDFLQLTVTMYTSSLKVYQLGRAILGGVGVLPVAPAANPGPPQEGGGFYALQLSQNTAYLMTVRKEGEISNSTIEAIPGLDQKNKVHIGIRVNKERKTISLLVDGALIKTWQEPQEFAGRGTCIRFVQQGQAPLNLSNIKIGAWDGAIEPPASVAANATQDLVHLKNQDTLTGTLQSIRDGQLAFVTSYGPLEIPMPRVSQIELFLEKTSLPKAEPGTVRAHFADGGRVTFRLEEWRDQQIRGSSPAFGRAQFNPAAFNLIEFNATP